MPDCRPEGTSRRRAWRSLPLLVAGVLALASSGCTPVIGGCPVFPADNAWNQDISRAPVDTSHDYIGSLGSMTLWPDFGGNGQYGIPYVSVPSSQPLVPISFDVAEESDPGPYPIPPDAPVEGGGDRHVIALRQGDCKLFELYAAERQGAGWHAYSGAVWNLRSNALRPEGWTSADAAGLPILPGLARRDEADSGAHQPRAADHGADDPEGLHPSGHALGVVEHRSRPAPDGPAGAPQGELRHQPPARPGASGRPGPQDLWRVGGRQRRLAARLHRGAVDPGWIDDDLNGLKTIPASALEAVRTNPVVRGY